jgi:hypothetical protein
VVNFSQITVEGRLYFYNCSLEKSLIFTPNKIRGILYFEETLFTTEASFVWLDFKQIDNPKLGKEHKSFSNVTFKDIHFQNEQTVIRVHNIKEDSDVKIHFKKCGFYGKNVAFTNVAMRCVAIQGGNYVSGMSFYHCDWASIHSFLGLKFRAFQGIKSSDRSKIAESYGNLKVSALDAGDAQLSNDFHFWHQWHQWENLYKKRLWNWNNFYRITSAYGMSVRLPLFWFLLTFLILWLPYDLLLRGQVSTCCESLPHWIPFEGLFVSGSASIPFIFSDAELIKSLMPKDTTHWQTVAFYGLYILQHLIQGYLLFQIGAAIRNKVKR